jgi:hypothetical protein
MIPVTPAGAQTPHRGGDAMTWLSPLAWMALLGTLATLTSLVLAWGAWDTTKILERMDTANRVHHSQTQAMLDRLDRAAEQRYQALKDRLDEDTGHGG